MTYVEQYWSVINSHQRCIVANIKPSWHSKEQDWMDLLGAADNYCELPILEELMLTNMEGLA